MSWISRRTRLQREAGYKCATRTTWRADTMTARQLQPLSSMTLLLGRYWSVRPKSNAPQPSQRDVWNIDASAATRGVRDWSRMGERQPAKHHSSLASHASLSGRKRALLERSCWPRGWPWARADTGRSPWQFGKRRQRSSLLCFIASVCRFRAAFFSGPGSISVSLRHSACKAHITSKHSLASKTAAQRIKADICGSALPITRKEEKQ